MSWLFQEETMNVMGTDWNKIFQIMVSEVVASFLVVLFYLTQTEEKTMLSKERAISCFIIAASYVGSRSLCASNILTYSGAVLNPAIGFGACIVEGVRGLDYIWVYALFPFIGSIIAVLFHEFVFKKTQEVLNEDEAQDDPDSLLDK